MRLAAGLRPDPLESLLRSYRPPSWILGVGTRKEGEGKGGVEEREERKGEGRKERGKGKEGGSEPPIKKAGYGPAIYNRLTVTVTYPHLTLTKESIYSSRIYNIFALT